MRPPARRRPADPRTRVLPVDLWRSIEYLACKESLGESLAASERARLDAHRQAEHYRAYLEATASAFGTPPGRGGGS